MKNQDIKRERVLILSPFFEPNTGGVETHLRDLCKYLRKKDRYVTVITYQPLTTKSKAPILEKKDDKFVIHRIPWIGHNLFHKFEEHPFLQFLYLTPLLFVYTFFFLLKNHRKYKTIHAHGLTAVLISNFVCKVFRPLSFVVSIHAIYEFKKGQWLSNVCCWALRPAKKIFCLAEASRDDLRKLDLPEEKLDIYIQWVDQDNFKPRNKKDCRERLMLKDKFTILFVGRLLEKKGVKVLLKTAKKLRNINFIFVGDGPMFDEIKKAEEEIGNILAVGKKEQEETALYYDACDLVAVPSQYEEGFARVVLETLSSGRPIIASNSGCLPEMITSDVGVLIKPTVENLTAQIKLFYDNPEKLLALEKNCRDYALKNFSEPHAEPIVASY